jgi:hypothetical protein
MRTMRTVGYWSDVVASSYSRGLLQTDAAVRSRVEGTNVNPFLYRRTSSRGSCHIISAHVFMLCLPNHAH